MNLFICPNQVKEVVIQCVSLKTEELVDYTRGMLLKDIDGEIIRSYFIVYKDGIEIIWNGLVDFYPGYKETKLTEYIRICIEEALEEVDFDEIFSVTIDDIKKAQSK